MIRTLSVQIALLFFAVATAAGLLAGNSPTTILTRAMIAMAVAYPLTQLLAWTARMALRDHLVRRKLNIDREHLAGTRAQQADPSRSALGPEAG